jgi:hypothetical protein
MPFPYPVRRRRTRAVQEPSELPLRRVFLLMVSKSTGSAQLRNKFSAEDGYNN